ncbi:hypothetical protein [Cruoricaptor ignavus]|uniref:hypothetical protein n=1 Tax=Cruoricaptor ignavus TaxID=1118202 RepID=UPI0013564C79|nr:hypothetical protein [Cruoricaptor ignavus]
MINFHIPNAKLILFSSRFFCQRSSAHLQKAKVISNVYFAKELISPELLVDLSKPQN